MARTTSMMMVVRVRKHFTDRNTTHSNNMNHKGTVVLMVINECVCLLLLRGMERHGATTSLEGLQREPVPHVLSELLGAAAELLLDCC